MNIQPPRSEVNMQYIGPNVGVARIKMIYNVDIHISPYNTYTTSTMNPDLKNIEFLGSNKADKPSIMEIGFMFDRSRYTNAYIDYMIMENVLEDIKTDKTYI